MVTKQWSWRKIRVYNRYRARCFVCVCDFWLA